MDYNVWNIIYKYVFDSVVQSITEVVDKFYGNVDKFIVSTKCTMHKCTMQQWCLNEKKLKWIRSGSRDNVCFFLRYHTTTTCRFNVYPFSSDFSIINAVVYRAENRVYPVHNYTISKICLVPYFESDHCWQDLALKYIRQKQTN